MLTTPRGWLLPSVCDRQSRSTYSLRCAVAAPTNHVPTGLRSASGSRRFPQMGGILFNWWNWPIQRCIGQSAAAAIASVPTGRRLPMRYCTCGHEVNNEFAATSLQQAETNLKNKLTNRLEGEI